MPKVTEERLAQLSTPGSLRSLQEEDLADLCADLREARARLAQMENTLSQYREAWERWHYLAEKLSALALRLAEHDEKGAKEYVEEIAQLARTELTRLRKEEP